ncbi:MAG: patatin-like phospholipase family protein [Porphyromonadaceae bacterium]|nr:patatin-like phospholipase family protein [Porphyromonadaceae bacterium]
MSSKNKEIFTASKTFEKLFSAKPYKIGLALSGGGIKGMCHAGALKALEENSIKPDIISGVSAGAIVAALYADGHSPDEIGKIFEHIEFRKMTKLQRPSGGFFTTKPFERFLGSKLRAKTFEELQIPIRIVATNLDTGQIEIFTKGNLLEAAMASSTVPVLFNPKIINGNHYVDGGVLKNFPVSTIRDDCEKVIGINASPMTTAEYKKSVMGIAMRTYHFMFKSNILNDKALCDVLIEPVDVGNYEMFETDKSREIFDLGYNTAKKIFKMKDFSK